MSLENFDHSYHNGVYTIQLAVESRRGKFTANDIAQTTGGLKNSINAVLRNMQCLDTTWVGLKRDGWVRVNEPSRCSSCHYGQDNFGYGCALKDPEIRRLL